MTDHIDDHIDFDVRLRTLLVVRAAEVDPALSGPELRRLAGERTSGTRRIVAAASAAAAVVVVALATQHLGESRAPQRGPAGHPHPTPSTSAPLLPAPPPTPSHSPRRSTTTPPVLRSSGPTGAAPSASSAPTTVRSSPNPTIPSTSAALSAPGSP